MDIREKITEVLEKDVADIFMLELDYVASHHDMRFREDLAASSVQYFPIISTLEEEFDLEIDFHEFQNEGRTIELAIDFVVDLYKAHYK